MKQEVTHFGRFYALFNKLPWSGDRDEFKKSIVLQYTWNRTDSLREMTRCEYESCCKGLEELLGLREALRKNRSLCLKLMQKCGVDTTDWQRINDFCRHPRISGKEFSRLGIDDLGDLQVKLRAILRKGGLKKCEGDKSANLNEGREEVYVVSLSSKGEA